MVVPRDRAAAGRARPRSRPRSKVLLAEDNPVNALLARTMLERAGCKVTHAVNGQKVIDILDSGVTPSMIRKAAERM